MGVRPHVSNQPDTGHSAEAAPTTAKADIETVGNETRRRRITNIIHSALALLHWRVNLIQHCSRNSRKNAHKRFGAIT